MNQDPDALTTPAMVQAYQFPSRELRLPPCFRRWTFDSPPQPPGFPWLLPFVGVVAGSRVDQSGAFLPVLHFATLRELCRYRLRVVPRWTLEGHGHGAPVRRKIFPRSYHWDLHDTRGRVILGDVRRLWHRSYDVGELRAGVIYMAQRGWRDGQGVSRQDYSANLWELFALADRLRQDAEDFYSRGQEEQTAALIASLSPPPVSGSLPPLHLTNTN